jgi:hypothetical protein
MSVDSPVPTALLWPRPHEHSGGGERHGHFGEAEGDALTPNAGYAVPGAGAAQRLWGAGASAGADAQTPDAEAPGVCRIREKWPPRKGGSV